MIDKPRQGASRMQALQGRSIHRPVLQGRRSAPKMHDPYEEDER
ncbi:hypothetical protein [Thioalkalivibrio sp. HK1]|nr:hypothetical protein [Thioalkalivibrio sp. HK1]